MDKTQREHMAFSKNVWSFVDKSVALLMKNNNDKILESSSKTIQLYRLHCCRCDDATYVILSSALCSHAAASL